MSTISIGLNADHGYVILAGAAVGVLTNWQAWLVGHERKKAGINYPQYYAEKAEMESSKAAKIFNCVQRAHGNTMEHVPIILSCLAFNGLFQPRVSAGITGVWVLSRFLYTLGYRTGEPNKRTRASFGGCLLSPVLVGLAIYNGVQVVLSGF